MADEPADLLAGRRVPQDNDPVVGGGGQQRGDGREGGGPHLVAVALRREHFLAHFHVQKDDSAADACRQRLAVGREIQGAHERAFVLNPADLTAGLGVPDSDDAARFGRGQRFAVGRDRHVENLLVLGVRQLPEPLAGFHVPEGGRPAAAG